MVARLRIPGASAASTPGTTPNRLFLRTDPFDTFDDTTGLTVQFAVGAHADLPALQLIDRDQSTVFLDVLQAYTAVYDRMLGATHSVFVTPTGIRATIDPICVEFAGGAPRLYIGTGAPGTTFTGTGRTGDIYVRRDGAAATFYYLCTTAGTPGTWTAYA